MKRILWVANALALRAGEQKIYGFHFKEACSYLELLPEGRESLSKLMNIENSSASCPTSVSELIKEGQQAKELPISIQLRRRLDKVPGGIDAVISRVQSNPSDTTTANGSDPKESEFNATTLLKRIHATQDELNSTVLEQVDAVEAICDALAQRVYRKNENTPIGVFLFVGPTASGKTLLAEKLATVLKDGWKWKSINMAALQSPNEGFALTGQTRGYSDARPGELTEFVKDNPKSVVILENIDKPHPNMLALIEPLFSTGILKDQFGFYPNNDCNKEPLAPPEVSFKDTIVIFTTNAGEDAYDDPGFQKIIKDRPAQIEPMILSELAQLPSRFDSNGGKANFFSLLLLRVWRLAASFCSTN